MNASPKFQIGLLTNLIIKRNQYDNGRKIMKSLGEFKGIQTRTSFDENSKSFVNTPIQHGFLQQLNTEKTVTATQVSLIELVEAGLKLAA
jgi:hypothetical protein